MLPNIGIIGRARVGKDTAGAWLVENRGYERVAFADPLKEAALRVDPIISAEQDAGLREVVDLEGWECAKDGYPEIRRFLQELGAAIRTIDEDFWLRAAMKQVVDANDAGHPAVVTDVRYPNEAASLRRAGFVLIYIERPGAPHLDHESEGALTEADADYHLVNDGDVTGLHNAVEFVVEDSR
ncbi:deoxynucleotide monophosphate kinase family protein [Streptomyces sp. SM8]|jgi:hypothetical protein|uniref:deoxynucleotide monophosphate kinase family protein n=1 Tax=Streptomyces sp. SM8 TaxID=1195457 RepID=UPI0002830EAC|nr:hypothetical protein [Streptomyces sp. SM8]PKA37909.1 hypothetical protein SM8_029240 [Streptomyces sp. SM8]